MALASGCVSYVHSPPARIMALESAKALNPGETGIQVEVGGGGGGTGLGLTGVTARARHGVVEGLDVNGEFGYLRLSPDVDLVDGDHGNVFMARAGLKYAVRPWIAFTLGLGGGAWTGGGFFSPDIAMILSWENPYFVPFVSGGGYLSQPINAQPVSLRARHLLVGHALRGRAGLHRRVDRRGGLPHSAFSQEGRQDKERPTPRREVPRRGPRRRRTANPRNVHPWLRRFRVRVWRPVMMCTMPELVLLVRFLSCYTDCLTEHRFERRVHWSCEP